jgi:hypothetical protein
MASRGELQGKYTYRFNLPAKNPVESRNYQPLNAEVQAYVNEILGVWKAKAPEDGFEKA